MRNQAHNYFINVKSLNFLYNESYIVSGANIMYGYEMK